MNFNWPRLGQLMANDLIGVAVDPNGNVLQVEQSDQASISSSGIIQKVASFSDVKDQTTLNAAVAAELPLISNPTNSPVTFTLNEKAYPLGIYDVGDIVTCSVTTDALVIAPTVKRIVGITVNINDQGREMITVQLNNPLPGQIAGSGN